MIIERKAYEILLRWKHLSNRKPLLIRGARQVGKTTLIRQFAKEFSIYIELNLEKDSERELFEIEDINKLLSAAYILKGVKPKNKSTLLFIDEIQESPKAIQKLRYFYEEKPDIFVIAAGSLLEFALSKVPAFPVGRIDYLYLHPINFEEYLSAIKNDEAIKILNTYPIPEYAHKQILRLFHDFIIIGGMPEIVKQYIISGNIATLSKSYNKLWQSFKDDTEKYAKNNTNQKIIRHVIETAPYETDRIKFEGFGNSVYRSREVGEALRSLDKAKIIQLIYPATNTEPPVNTDFKKRPRLQFIDTGLINHVLMLQGEMIALNDFNNFYKGKVIQHMVSQELMSVHEETEYKPHFWVREKKDSNSEVDLVYQYGKYIFPIEIKSGKQGRLRSLHQFIERTNHSYAIRLYAGKFNIEKTKTPGGKKYLLMNLPYYLGSKIPEYIKYFIENY
ncbi:MAG: AAA family ATPase [Bacteroidales bacterium]|nr:AAA family ATPase [Bacteroidales bacterium]